MKGAGWLVIGGLLTLAMGVFALGNAVAASIAVTVITGVTFLIGGSAQIIGGFMVEGVGAKIVSILLGLIIAFLGLSFIQHPLAGTVSLTMLVLILFMSTGILRLFYAWTMRDTQYFWPMLISGAASVFLAIYVASTFNLTGAGSGEADLTAEAFKPVLSVLGILVGIELTFNGFGMIAMGLFLRSDE